jgi:tight adherence protein B
MIGWSSALVLVAMSCITWLVLRGTQRALRAGTGLLGQRTEADLAQLFVFVNARALLCMTAALVLLCALLSYLLGVPGIYLPLVLLGAASAPRVTLQVLRKRRRAAMAAQLPEALALWAGLLRSGMGLMPALTQVAARQPGALGEELRLLLSQQRLGMSMNAAFAALRDRAGVADLGMLATLLHTNRELGGNLAESLQRLADLLRSRLAMQSRIASLTAQGKLQGAIVGALPLLLLIVLYAMEPAAMRMLHTTWQGWTALGVLLLLEATGFLLIRRIVRIDV